MINFKRILKESELLIEQATVGSYDSHKVTLYTEPLGNPSFHIRYKDDWEIVLSLSDFKIIEVKFGKFKKGTYLPNSEMKDLISFLKQKEGKITYWEKILMLWNAVNEKYPIEITTKIPN